MKPPVKMTKCLQMVVSGFESVYLSLLFDGIIMFKIKLS